MLVVTETVSVWRLVSVGLTVCVILVTIRGPIVSMMALVLAVVVVPLGAVMMLKLLVSLV